MFSDLMDNLTFHIYCQTGMLASGSCISLTFTIW
jgi:hypothetical protein